VFLVSLMYLLVLDFSFVFSTSATDCLKRFGPEMTCYHRRRLHGASVKKLWGRRPIKIKTGLPVYLDHFVYGRVFISVFIGTRSVKIREETRKL